MLGCRHCYADCEAHLMLQEQQQVHQQEQAVRGGCGSYSGTLVYGSMNNLQEFMAWIERQEPIPGISVW